MVAAQCGTLKTNAYKVEVLGFQGTTACRLCQGERETIAHILSSCPEHTWGLIKTRHDKMVYQLAKSIVAALNLKAPGHFHSPRGVAKPEVVTTNRYRILIDQTIPTNRQIRERRPDIVLFDKSERRITVCDVACAWEPLVSEREKEKKRKYRELAADLAGQWSGYKVDVIAVVVGTLGLVCNLDGNLKRLGIFSGRERVTVAANLQREAICSGVQILKRHLVLDDS